MLHNVNFSIKKAVLIILPLSICIWFASSQVVLVDVLNKFTVTDFASLSLLTLLILFIMSLQFNILVRIFDVLLKFNEWFGLTAINTMSNYLLPAKTGSVIRGIYLKKNHELPYSHYTSVVIASHIISLIILSFVGGMVGIWYLDQDLLSIKNMTIILLLLLGVATILYFLLPLLLTLSKRILHEKVVEIISKIYNGFLILFRSKKIVLTFSVLTFSALLCWALRLQVCFSSLGLSLSFTEVLIIQVLVNTSFLFSVTPGNIGVKEGVTAFIASQLGIEPGIAVIASLLDRTVAMAVVLIVGTIYSNILLSGETKA